MAKDSLKSAIKQQVKIAGELGIFCEDLERIRNAKSENEAIAIKRSALMRLPDSSAVKSKRKRRMSL